MATRVPVTPSARLTKPVEALVMIPRAGRLTAVGRKLYNVMLQFAQTQLKQGRIPHSTECFEAPMRYLLDPVGRADADYRELAKKYLVEMQDVTIEWDSPELSAGSEWKRLRLLSEVEIFKRNGELFVSWALPPTLVRTLADPTLWTSLELTVMSRLNTYAAVALYEICARYKNNPSGVTGKNAPVWWIDALSSSPPAIDPDTKEPKRREWRKFKHEFVAPAIAQINEHTDLEVELIEIRRGRIVSDVQFAVRKKLHTAPAAQLPPAVAPALMERATRAGISENELDTILRRHSAAEVAGALAQLEQRLAMPTIEEVRSPAAYLRHLLQREPEAVKPPPPAEAARVRAGQGVLDVVPRPAASNVIPWIQVRREEVAVMVAALPIDEQRQLLAEVVDDLKSKQMFTPSVARRAAQGEWMVAGVLKSKMVDLYAQRHLGPGWDREPPPIPDRDVQVVEVAEA